jgi:uncharacterized RDD family membrane protein YckC
MTPDKKRSKVGVSMSNVIPLNNSSSPSQEKKSGKLRNRFYAFYIDFICISATQKILTYIYMTMIDTFLRYIPLKAKFNLLNQVQETTLPVLFTVTFGYYFLSYYLGEGRTLGKGIMHIRVTSQVGNPRHLSFKEALMRTIGSFLNYPFFFWILLNKQRRSLADHISQTEVLSEAKFEDYLASIEKEKKNTLNISKQTTQYDLFTKAS